MIKKEIRKQKEAEKNRKPVSRKTQDEIFRELQRTLKPEAKSSTIQQGPEHVRRTTLNRPSLLHERKKHSATAQSPSRIIRKTAEVSEKEKYVSALKEEIVEEFDPRKAVIFSEILKRPQF